MVLSPELHSIQGNQKGVEYNRSLKYKYASTLHLNLHSMLTEAIPVTHKLTTSNGNYFILNFIVGFAIIQSKFI